MAPLLTFRDTSRDHRAFRDRVIVAALAMLLAIVTVIGRLVQLQIVEHDRYTTLSTDNRVRILPLPPTRGLIYSSDGELVAENRASFTLQVTPEQIPDLDATIAELERVVDIDAQNLERFRRTLKQKRHFEGVPLKVNLSEEEVARFSLDSYRFPGVQIEPTLIRHYPMREALAHVLGYVGRIDEDDLDDRDAANYRGTDFIGKAGVEKTYENVLHGRTGYQQVEVNAEGRVLRVLKTVAPVPGKDLYLTIDSSLQGVAIDALGGRRGAVVAIDPDTGGVLALVSTPGYDANLFVNGIDRRLYKALRDAPDRPLFNRAMQGQYPPGSTIKPFVALAGLEYGVRAPADATWCPGWFSLRGHEHRYRCWKKPGHGHMSLRDAIAQSCDVYFYALANDLGIDRLSSFLARFGFGARTGVDLPGESSALLPTRAWKQRVHHQAWFPGETLIAGIGQGYTLATPLQLAVATATLAKHGLRIEPHVVGQIEDPVTHDATEISAHVAVDAGVVDAGNWQEVVGAMHEVVQGEHGTARKVGLDAPYAFAGKTGTAQVFGIKQNEEADDLDIPEHLKDHALFIAFAPLDVPQIAVAVIVENGGSGSGNAAPVARLIFDHYLIGRTPTPVVPPPAASPPMPLTERRPVEPLRG